LHLRFPEAHKERLDVFVLVSGLEPVATQEPSVSWTSGRIEM